MSQGTTIRFTGGHDFSFPGGYDPARLFRGLDLHGRLEAAIERGEARLQQPLSAKEVEKMAELSSRFVAIHHLIVA